MKKIILIFLMLLFFTAYAQAGSLNFQNKKAVIVPGAGNTYRLSIYKLTAIIGEVLGGESSSSARFSLSSGYLGDPQTIPGFDSTPPTTPVVIDDGDYTADNASLHVTWSSEDLESDIAEYFYLVPGIIEWTSAGLGTEATLTDLNLSHGSTYYFQVKVINNAGLESDIGVSDGIIVNLSEPVINSLKPSNLSKLYEANTIEIKVNAVDSDGDTLEYQYIVDGRIQLGEGERAWFESNIYIWNILDSAIGKAHTIQVNVRDGNGAVVSQQTKIFILHKPISPPYHPTPQMQ